LYNPHKFLRESCADFLIAGSCIFPAVLLKYVAYNISTQKGVIDTDEYLSHSFKKAHFLMEQAINQRLTELELTTAQGHVIGYIRCSKEPPCARDIETAFGLSHATVSGILSRMESKGFIALRPDAADRRVKRIHLLQRGLACTEEIRRHIEDTETAMSDGFTPGELQQFRSFLTRAIGNLSPQPKREE